MRAVVCPEPHQIRLIETDRPEAKEGEALLRVRRVGVCGTDLHAFQGQQPFFSYPRVLGHELGAEVVEVPGDSDLAVGDPVVVVPYVACQTCVACRRGRPNCCQNICVLGVHADGGMREYLPVPTRNLIAAPGLDFDSLALVECLSIGAHAVRRAEVEQGEDVLVIGAGPIGLGVLQFAREAGGRVIALDMNEERLAFWRDTLGGGETVLAGEGARERIEELTDGSFPTVVIDATGHNGSMAAAIELCAHSARLVYVGLTTKEITFLHTELHKRELDLRASRNATNEDFQKVLDAMKAGTVKPSCMITHRADLEGAVANFDAWTKPETGVIKAMLEV
jgi:2-desacetyl-2-hydroxyethyl bacteriochlorophyllide A dehydrogenase